MSTGKDLKDFVQVVLLIYPWATSNTIFLWRFDSSGQTSDIHY